MWEKKVPGATPLAISGNFRGRGREEDRRSAEKGRNWRKGAHKPCYLSSALRRNSHRSSRVIGGTSLRSGERLKALCRPKRARLCIMDQHDRQETSDACLILAQLQARCSSTHRSAPPRAPEGAFKRRVAKSGCIKMPG